MKKIKRVISLMLVVFILLGNFTLNININSLNAKGEEKTTNKTKIKKEIERYFKNFPLITFPIKLGDFEESEELKVKEVEIDEATNKKVIVWEYISTIKGANKRMPNKIERYFTTTTESGLGQAEIISIKKDGVEIAKNIAISKNEYLNSKLDTQKGENVKNGTYNYTIKTPVIAPRTEYVLNINTTITVELPKNTEITVDGIEQKLEQRKTIKKSKFLSHSMPSRYELPDYVENSPTKTTIAENGRNVAGDYIDRDTIRWTQSYINMSNENTSLYISTKPDSSHVIKGNTKILVYRPTEDRGYELVEEHSTNETSFEVQNLGAGYIVQAVTETKVNDPYKNHTLNGAELKALKGNLTIEKIWATDVKEEEKKDLTFKIKGGNLDEDVVLKKGEKKYTKFGIDKFDDNFRRIIYDITEHPVSGFALYNQNIDRDSLTYIFYNKKFTPSGGKPTPQPNPNDQKKCTDYGITSIKPIEINQYRRQDSAYSWGAKLRGTFKIPANATAGDKFILKFPKELYLSHPIDPTKKLFNIIGNIKGRDVIIGYAYHTSRGEITFKLLNSAKAPLDYEGSFEIGETTKGVVYINGIEADKNKEYETGITPSFGNIQTNSNPQDKIFVDNLTFKSIYYGYNGELKPCEKNIKTPVTIHSEDDSIFVQTGALSIDVLKETDDSLEYAIIFNSASFIKNKNQIFAYLTSNIALYHGNNNDSFVKDIEVYEADPARIGYVVNSSMKQIWPYKDPASSPKLKIRAVTDLKANENSMVKGFDGKYAKVNYKVKFSLEGHDNQTIVIKLKTRKIKPHSDGYFYNDAWFPGIPSYRAGSQYIPTIGIGGAKLKKTYSIKLKKVDEFGKIIKNNPGIFTLLSNDDSYNNKVASDENGIIKFDNIPIDTSQEYEFFETKAPYGYKLDTTKYRIRFFYDNGRLKLKIKEANAPDSSYVVYDTQNEAEIYKQVNKKLPILKIRKIDAKTSKPLKGAAFKLTEYDKNTKKLKREIILGKNGNINLDVEEFNFYDLKNDSIYKLEEIESPKGYLKIHKARFFLTKIEKGIVKIKEVESLENQRFLATQIEIKDGFYTIDVENKRENKITFIKKDKYGNKISDSTATFALYKKDNAGTKVIELINGTSIKVSKIENSMRGLDKDSTFHYVNLADGDYYLIEENAPEGYIKSKYPLSIFSVESGEIHSSSLDNIIDIMNYPKGRFKIIKTDDSDKNIPLEGVEFKLFSDFEMTKLIDTKTTDSKGLVYFENLDVGVYYLKETKGKFGYKISDEIRKIVVNKTGETLIETISLSNYGLERRTLKKQNPKKLISERSIFDNLLLNSTNIYVDVNSGNYRQDLDFSNGKRTIQSDLKVEQTIHSTNQQGRYRVDVKAEGNGLVNQKKSTDILIMLQAGNGIIMYGSEDFYKERIRDQIIAPLQKRLPHARIAFATWHHKNKDFTKTHFEFTSIEDAHNRINSAKWSKNSGNRDWNVFVEKINEIMGKSTADNKIVLSISGTGVYEKERDSWKNAKESLRKIIKDYDFYSISEAVYDSKWKEENYTSFEDELIGLGLEHTKGFTIANNFQEIGKTYNIEEEYKIRNDIFTERVGNDFAKLNIELADNVIFDGIENFVANTMDSTRRLNYDLKTNSIIGENFKFLQGDQTPKISFSYYVRANSEDKNAMLNVMQNINKSGYIMPRVATGVLSSFPLPQIKIPGIDISIKREWATGIPEGYKDFTLIQLLGKNGKLHDEKLLHSETLLNFSKSVPQYDNFGNDIPYTIVEIGLHKNLKSTFKYYDDTRLNSIKGNGGNITIFTDIKTIDFNVIKNWKNTKDIDKKDIEVELKAKVDGKEVPLQDIGITSTFKTLNKNNNYQTKFENLPQFNSEGKEIFYYAIERLVNGQTVDVKDYSVNYIYENGYTTIINEKISEINIINKRSNKLKILKRDFDKNNQNPLNAKFELFKFDESLGFYIPFKDGKGYSYISNIDGFTVNDLTVGKYILVELEAPNEYNQLPAKIYFEIDKLTATPQNFKFVNTTIEQKDSQEYVGDIIQTVTDYVSKDRENAYSKLVSNQYDEVKKEITLTIKNEKIVIQPKLNIYKQNVFGDKLTGEVRFKLYKVDNRISAEDIDAWSKNHFLNAKGKGDIWHNHTPDKTDDTIFLKNKDKKILYNTIELGGNNPTPYAKEFILHDGKLENIDISDLEIGKYLLVETKPAKDYDILNKPVLLELKSEGKIKVFRRLGVNNQFNFSSEGDMIFTIKDYRLLSKFAMRKYGLSPDPNIKDYNLGDVEFTLTKLNIANDEEFAKINNIIEESMIDKTSIWGRDDKKRLISDTSVLPNQAKGGKLIIKQKVNSDKDYFVFSGLIEGYYILRETKAPQGYSLNLRTYKIKVNNEGTINISYKDDKGNIKNHDKIHQYEMDNKTWIVDTSNLLEIENRKVVYPSTGGNGITPFIVIGGLMMLMSVVYVGKNRKLI